MIREHVHRLTNQMQLLVGYLEIGQPEKALPAAKAAIVELHLLATSIAAGAAALDMAADDAKNLTGELAQKHRSRPTPM